MCSGSAAPGYLCIRMKNKTTKKKKSEIRKEEGFENNGF